MHTRVLLAEAPRGAVAQSARATFETRPSRPSYHTSRACLRDYPVRAKRLRPARGGQRLGNSATTRCPLRYSESCRSSACVPAPRALCLLAACKLPGLSVEAPPLRLMMPQIPSHSSSPNQHADDHHTLTSSLVAPRDSTGPLATSSCRACRSVVVTGACARAQTTRGRRHAHRALCCCTASWQQAAQELPGSEQERQ